MIAGAGCVQGNGTVYRERIVERGCFKLITRTIQSRDSEVLAYLDHLVCLELCQRQVWGKPILTRLWL